MGMGEDGPDGENMEKGGRGQHLWALGWPRELGVVSALEWSCSLKDQGVLPSQKYCTCHLRWAAGPLNHTVEMVLADSPRFECKIHCS